MVINFERALAPQPGEFDWGFKLQFMYGSDARFIHSLGLFSDTAATSIVQPDLVEGYLSLHLPLLTDGGLDLKLGKWVTLEGAETIDPRTNFFYSHTYIFNFGIPFNHTGALATLHATKWLDLMAGVTRGVNTSIDDNNDSLAFHGGIGLNFNEGKLVVAARPTSVLRRRTTITISVTSTASPQHGRSRTSLLPSPISIMRTTTAPMLTPMASRNISPIPSIVG
jgi:hypothetical protein